MIKPRQSFIQDRNRDLWGIRRRTERLELKRCPISVAGRIIDDFKTKERVVVRGSPVAAGIKVEVFVHLPFLDLLEYQVGSDCICIVTVYMENVVSTGF
jgi:hypothetical protein